MIKSGKYLALFLAGAFMLAACSNLPSKKQQGAVIGAAAGATLGSTIGGGSGKVLAVAAGMLIGAIVGEAIGDSIDKQDELAMAEAEGRATKVPLGEEIEWQNPKNGNHGTVTPTRDGKTPSGRYCREYKTTVTIDGKTRDAHGIACRKPDGSWEIVSRE